jgi:2-hydroxy-3-oxopropionate reductase
MDDVIGVVGLGKMGMAMVKQLVAAGRNVVVFARKAEQADAAVAVGASAMRSIAELGAATRVVIVSVRADADVHDVVLGSHGLAATMPRGSLIVDTSTISPSAAQSIHATLGAEYGISFVDAPVSGGPGGVAAGTLAVMAGGEDEALSRAELALAPFTGRFVRCGPPGSGQVAKACNQLVVVATLQVVSEALVLAKKAGADVAAVRSALLGGYAASRIMELHGQRMIDRDFVPGGSVSMQRKDIGIINALAHSVGGVVMPAYAAAARNVVRLDEAGGGELDHSALVVVAEHDAATQLGATPELRFSE